MNDMSDDGKENEETTDANAEEQKKPDLDDTLSRLLRTKEDKEREENEDSTH